MNRVRPRPLHLMVLIQAVLCSSVAHGQIPERLQRCPPSPTFAEQGATLRHNSQSAVQPKNILIDAVSFDEPVSLPNTDLAQLTGELEQRKFDAASDWVGELTDSIVRRMWQDNGYFKADVTVAPEILSRDSGGQHVALTIHVDEGPQYSLGDLRFRSADPHDPLVFPSEQLRKLVSLQEGDVFDADKIRQSLDATRRLYGSSGYIDATMQPTLDVDGERRHINLTIQIDQQKQYRIGKIEVLGLDPTTETSLRAMMKPGDVFDIDVVRQFFDENRAALPGDASMEDVELKRDSKNGTVNMRFNLLACPSSEIN